jgi:hypothetical protein
LPVIVTLPQERVDVFESIKVLDSKLLIKCPTMSFDTCDRWKRGFREALCNISNEIPDHLYLWSADFNYNTGSQTAADRLLSHRGAEDLVIMTIEAAGRKCEIDTIGTYPLLKNWFPSEFGKMLDEGFTKPRSELLRISREFCASAIGRRWYPTEQTIYLILQSFWEDQWKAVSLPSGTQLCDDDTDKKSPNVVQQIERMELWLKYIWRDRHKGWDRNEYLNKVKASGRIVRQACEQLL